MDPNAQRDELLLEQQQAKAAVTHAMQQLTTWQQNLWFAQGALDRIEKWLAKLNGKPPETTA